MNYEERSELEFNILLHSFLGNTKIEERDYDLDIGEDDIIEATFTNYNTYASAKYNQYYILMVKEYNDADATESPFILHYTLKPEFVNFDNKKFVECCEWYRRLFGVTMDIRLKRLISFLLNMTNWKTNDEGLKKFLNKCPDDVREEIKGYVWSKLFNVEDQALV